MLDLRNKEQLMVLGSRIRSAREEKELTQEALAEQIDIDRTTLSAWENGKQAPDTVLLCDLCRALGVDMGYLFWDYEAKTLDINFIWEKTGLSEKAIKTLYKWHNKPFQPLIRVLNQLLEKKSFSAVLAAVWNYCSSIQEHKSKDTTGAINITVETGLPTDKEINLWTASHKFTKCIENLSQPF